MLLVDTFFISKTLTLSTLLSLAQVTGEKKHREIRENQNLKYNRIGFFDDNPVKAKKIMGYLSSEISIPFKTVPGMGELINGKVIINAIREVDHRDFSGREVLPLTKTGLGVYLEKNVLITGAGGSIGLICVRRVACTSPVN